METSEGLSVVICCHNSANRLSATLAHLKVQDRPPVPWEVVVIDNASTDGTSEMARSCWREGPAPMRIISEPRLGLQYARERAFASTRYPFLSFVDDDNWLAHDWVRTAYNIMSSDRGLGAVSGILAPACEVPSPAWFDDFHSRYAILTENDFDQEKELSYLPGAGLCLRKSALDGLIQDGFRFQLTGRVGKNLLSGEDTELTLAMHLSGWRLRIDRRLRLQHFMPAERLRWDYLRHLERGHGASWVLLDAYSEHSLSLNPGLRRWVSERWWYQLCRAFVELGRRPRALVAALISNGEGDYSVIEFERLVGRILGLLRLRRRYGAARRVARETLGIQNSRAGAAVNFHTAA